VVTSLLVVLVVEPNLNAAADNFAAFVLKSSFLYLTHMGHRCSI
jgi:hypothetical protein